MTHTIEQISKEEWLIDGKHRIAYSDSFGWTGWYWDQGSCVFPPVKNSFLEVLEEIIGNEKFGKEKIPPLAGMS